jgi:ribosomal protein L11 methyltransferase
VAYENAALNDIGKDVYNVRIGNILGDEALRAEIGGGYDIVLANIVADVIIGLAPLVHGMMKPGGVFLCSGIIDTRAEEVAEKLRENGLDITDTRTAEGWYAYTCR